MTGTGMATESDTQFSPLTNCPQCGLEACYVSGIPIRISVRVLVEAAGRTAGTVNGRLDNNLVVEFQAPESLIGQWANVHLTGSRAALLVGELVQD